MDVTALATEFAYTKVPPANTGTKLPGDTVSALKFALLLSGIANAFEYSDVLLTVQVASSTPRLPAKHLSWPFQSPPLVGVSVIGVMSVTVISIVLPSAFAASVTAQRPAAQPLVTGTPVTPVLNNCSPMNVMLVAALLLTALMRKNSARKSAGPCVVIAQLRVVLPPVDEGAVEPEHAPVSAVPVQMCGAF